MSEFINNNEQRQVALQKILMEIHEGVPIEEVKQHFKEAFGNVDASELAKAEQALVANGLPVSEIQNLCDIHAEVTMSTIDQIHEKNITIMSSHPIEVMQQENAKLKEIVQVIKHSFNELPSIKAQKTFKENLEQLYKIECHYQRKENLIFPFMERHGIDVPPKVMWGVHDEIREHFKNIKKALNFHLLLSLKKELPETLDKVLDMIDKEENILFPMIIDLFTNEQWIQIAEESDEYGYFLIDTPAPMQNNNKSAYTETVAEQDEKHIQFPTGSLTFEEVRGIFDALPVDITFVGKDDCVKYFSHGETQAFQRSAAIIGRNVENCHPQGSLHVVKKLMDDFKSGKKKQEDFWIQRNEQIIFIRYIAIRNEKDEYIGVIELTQDIAYFQKITGEKRLLSE